MRVLLDQAAGIVIDLLVALSLIALLTAGVMLAASSRAEVQRRLAAIGVRRAVGAGRGHVALALGLQALLVAVPAATVGACRPACCATAGPGNRLLTLLNEPPPGSELVLPLAAGWLTSILIPALGAGWPAWRAAGAAARRVVARSRARWYGEGRPTEGARVPLGRRRSADLGGSISRRSARAADGDNRHARALDGLRSADAGPGLSVERAGN